MKMNHTPNNILGMEKWKGSIGMTTKESTFGFLLIVAVGIIVVCSAIIIDKTLSINKIQIEAVEKGYAEYVNKDGQPSWRWKIATESK